MLRYRESKYEWMRQKQQERRRHAVCVAREAKRRAEAKRKDHLSEAVGLTLRVMRASR